MAILSGFQEIDVHNMTKVQALAAIDARLRRANASVYRLKVIHGYHGGTVLRDAVRAHYREHPKVKRIEVGLNPGETDLAEKQILSENEYREAKERYGNKFKAGMGAEAIRKLLEEIEELKKDLNNVNLKACEEKITKLCSVNYGEYNEKILQIKNAFEQFDYRHVKDLLDDLIRVL